MNWKTFFICGLTGWCMEILFTSLGGTAAGRSAFKRTHLHLDVSDLRTCSSHRTSFRAPAPLACASARLFLRCRHHAR